MLLQSGANSDANNHAGTDESVSMCRYNLYGDVCSRAAIELRKPEVADFFAKLIQRFSPKSYPQALAEAKITQRFLENFSGDSVGLCFLQTPEASFSTTYKVIALSKCTFVITTKSTCQMLREHVCSVAGVQLCVFLPLSPCFSLHVQQWVFGQLRHH